MNSTAADVTTVPTQRVEPQSLPPDVLNFGRVVHRVHRRVSAQDADDVRGDRHRHRAQALFGLGGAVGRDDHVVAADQRVARRRRLDGEDVGAVAPEAVGVEGFRDGLLRRPPGPGMC